MLNFQTDTRYSIVSRAGMALAEYVLIGTAVLCVCVFAFMGVGQNMKEWLLGLKGDMQQHQQKAQATQTAVASAITAIEEKKVMEEAMLRAQGGSMKVDPSNPNALCSSTWCIEAPGLTGNYVYTAGSNGNQANSPANVAANIFSQMAKIMEEQGNADPGTIAFLTDMANRGHGLANSAYMMTSSDDYRGMKAGADGIAQNLNEFRQMSQQLSGMMTQFPPDVRAILNDASRVVIAVGESYDLDYTPRNGNAHIGYVHHIRKISLTHSKSNTICGSGGNQAQCIQ
jgi:hypothetical protein